MFKYQVTYSHENENSANPEERHGDGVMMIETDETITTQEQLIEIARSIGKHGNYTKVAVKSALQVIEEEDEK